MKEKLSAVYKKLYAHFGRQYWWPADSPFEVMVGAILTQNTSWENVEKAIDNLKKAKALDAKKMLRISGVRLAGLIKPAGYFNVKAKRLKNFLDFYINDYGADIHKIRKADASALRERLLSVNGIGPETADSILLYALNKPVFVVDTYTKRFMSRHGLAGLNDDYHLVQKKFMQNLEKDVKLFNEYHALIVKLGKELCRKTNPKCGICPLKENI